MRGKKATPPSLQSLAAKAVLKRSATLTVESSSDEDVDAAEQNAEQTARSRRPKGVTASAATAAAAAVVAIPQPSQSYPVMRSLLEDGWQTYQPPPAPKLPELDDVPLHNAANQMMMNPRATHAYRLSDETNKYVVLVGTGNSANLQIREFFAGNNNTLYPDNRKMAKLDEVMTANLVHLSKKIRDLMHDGGPAVGEEKFQFGRLLEGTLNPEFGPHLDVRHFFFPKDPLSHHLPTRRGVRLSKEEFDMALLAIQAIKPIWPAYDAAVSCIWEHSQEESQEAERLCAYCSPPRC